MLSIGAMAQGQATYYSRLAREDYYLQGGEPPGQWFGRGAQTLGLTGTVERESFLRTFHGFHPFADSTLVQNAGDPDRQCGWDLTFSAPKSASVLWGIADAPIRRSIQQAHDAAVKEALSYLEAECAWSRRGKGGLSSERAKLVVAVYEHGTSRAQDPQLHSHALVLNAALRDDGSTGTLESKPLYRAKMTAGALYRADLARRLEQLGFAIERNGRTFEVAGVPAELVETFSKRRAEIEQVLADKGLSSAKAAAIAALDTRAAKEHLPREQLLIAWRETARAFGFSPESLGRLRGTISQRNVRAEMTDAVHRAVERLAHEVSHFSRRELLRVTAEEAQGRGIGATHVRVAVDHELQRGELQELGVLKGETHYTTRELLALEATFLRDIDQLHARPGATISDAALTRAVREAETRETEKARQSDPDAASRWLGNEQLRALKHLTQSRGAVAVVSGMAGTGKTFLLNAARMAWEKEGRRVVGVALSGKAARGMQEGAAIQSRTIARLLLDLKAPGRASPLDARTVLVVDEAGMVGTRQMAALVAACRCAGSRLVLVGDRRQLQPIEVGGPFQAIERRIGRAELTEIIRQQPDPTDANPHWRRDAVRAFADGRAAEALAEFTRRGRLHVAEHRDAAMKSLIESWSEGGAAAPAQHLILAGTRSEARDLNRRAQAARRAEGRLGHRQARVGNETFFEHDRILITRNHYGFRVCNGDLGTIQRLDLQRGAMHVLLDDRREVELPLKGFEHVELGYSVTTHKSQGATVRYAYVLCGDTAMTDRELTYVQASRAQFDTHFFAPRLLAWDPEHGRSVDRTVHELTRQMGQSRMKDLAHDVIRGPETSGPTLTPVLQ